MSHQIVGITLLGAALSAAPAHADPVACQKAIVTGLRTFKKTYLKRHEKCLDAENLGKISGPCPDAVAQLKINTIGDKVVAKIATVCAPGDPAALGYPTTCNFEPGAGGKEAQCAALPNTSPMELAECLRCWKEAELSEFIGILYASHAVELCGSLDESSSTCSDLDCTTPLPDQRNLGNTAEFDCQRAIAKFGIKYLLAREKVLEKCGLEGGTSVTCFDSGNVDGAKVLVALDKAEQKKITGIKNKCGQRVPTASPPFCCRTGTANACDPTATTRDQCTMAPINGQVQEGKTCNGTTFNCDPVSGPNKPITWWESCPESTTCPGATLTSIDDLITCVDTSAAAAVDELMCLQFPTGWPCPSDTEGSTTTTTTSSTTTTT